MGGNSASSLGLDPGWQQHDDGGGAGADAPDTGTGPAPYASAGETAGAADSASAGADAGADAAGPLSGVESLGLVGGTDPRSLEAEVAAALGGAGGPPLEGATQAPAGAVPASWHQLTPPATKVLCCVVFPAWEITDPEQAEIAPALADCLEQVFPGGIDGKYACWVRLLITCGAIAVSRAVQNGGRLPPLFLTKAQAAARRGSDPPPARTDAPLSPDQLTSLGVA